MVTNALILTISNGSAIPDLNIIMQNLPPMLLNNMTIEKEHHLIPKESTALAAEARERILHAALPEVPLVAPQTGLPAVNSIKINMARIRQPLRPSPNWQNHRSIPRILLNPNILTPSPYPIANSHRRKVPSTRPIAPQYHLDSHAGCRPSLRVCTPLRAARDRQRMYPL